MEARRKSEELRQQLVRKQRLLDNTSLVSALPDKGEKIRQSIGDIQRQITKLKEIADEEDVAPPQTTHHPPSWPINSVHPATSQDAAFLAQQFANLMDMDSKNNDAEATEQRAMDMDLDESVSHEGVMMYGRYFPNELERRRFVKREQLRLGKVGFQQAQWDSKVNTHCLCLEYRSSVFLRSTN